MYEVEPRTPTHQLFWTKGPEGWRICGYFSEMIEVGNIYRVGVGSYQKGGFRRVLAECLSVSPRDERYDLGVAKCYSILAPRGKK